MMLSDLAAAAVALTQRGKKHLHRLILVAMHACVPGPRRATYGRLSPRWPEMQSGAARVFGANAWFSNEYDSKGNELMRLGHTPYLWRDCAKVVSVSAMLCAVCSWCASPILIAAVVAMTLHRLVARHCACLPVPRRPTWCAVTSLAGGAGLRE